MFRYLINFSYIGTSFRGVQRVIKRTADGKSDDIHSVQGVIELGLRRLRPANEIDAKLSSRTDTGVHALNTTLHVDLQREDGKAYNPNYITHRLNNTFYKYQIPVRINQTLLVPPDLLFHCRINAVGRRYLYRLAVIKPDKCIDKTHDRLSSFIPIEETDRCYFIQKPTFDLKAVQDVLPLFIGKHDFRTFMSLNPTVRVRDCTHSIRTLYSLKIKPANSCSTSYNLARSHEYYNFYDIEVTGKSFVYRQVRRIVGTLIALAQGRITKKDVYEMITIPGTHNWMNQIKIVPGTALYLCEVVYDKELYKQILAYNESFEQTTGQKRDVEVN